MNDASKWRLEVAQKVASFYAKNPRVKAMMVTGSVSRGWADRYSDVEMCAFWDKPPSLDERKAIIACMDGVMRRFEEAYIGWDNFYVGGDHQNGFEVECYHIGLKQVEEILSDVEKRLSHQFSAALRDALPLYGESLLRGWQARTHDFPQEAVKQMVVKVVQWFSGWQIWEMFARHREIPALLQHFVHAQDIILRILAPMNRAYYDITLKWYARNVEPWQIVPPNLAQRLREVFRLEPLDAVYAQRDLVYETFDLIEAHLPGVDTISAREAFEQPPPWVRTPDELDTEMGHISQALQQLAATYQDHPKVKTVARLRDSTGRRGDLFSNVELHVFWSELPNDVDRTQAIDRASGTLRHLTPYDADHKIAIDTCDIGNVRHILVNHHTVETVEQALTALVERAEYVGVSPHQDRLAVIQQLEAFSSESLIKRWQTKASRRQLNSYRAFTSIVTGLALSKNSRTSTDLKNGWPSVLRIKAL